MKKLALLGISEIWVCIALLLVGTALYSYQITRPLVDYDEAIYANRIVATLESGDIVTMSEQGVPQLDKPPLYFWATMPFVSTFGPQEWTFRVPGVFASVVCLLLTYLLVRKITGNWIAAAIGFLTLLFSPWFYFLAIEARLDSGVIAAILAALYAVIKGWEKEKYLLCFFPAIAIGFLIKMVIVLLAFPVVLIFSASYNQWQWMKSKYLWLGSLVAAALLLPWHLIETVRFGWKFWNEYLFGNLLRVSSTVTGTNGPGDYVVPLMNRMPLWFWLYIACIVSFLIVLAFPQGRKYLDARKLAAPLVSALFIFIFFNVAKTHLASYVLPAYPFFAIFIALLAWKALSLGKRGYAILGFTALLIVAGVYYCFSIPWTNFQDESRFAYDEKGIGTYYRTHQSATLEPLYSMQWGGLDSLNFYSGTSTRYVSIFSKSATIMKAPLYVVATIELLNLIHQSQPETLKQFDLVYTGKYLALLYTDKDLSVGGSSSQ